MSFKAKPKSETNFNNFDPTFIQKCKMFLNNMCLIVFHFYITLDVMSFTCPFEQMKRFLETFSSSFNFRGKCTAIPSLNPYK